MRFIGNIIEKLQRHPKRIVFPEGAEPRVLQANGSDYTPIFVVCGLAYVTAWTIIHVLAPRLEPARLGHQEA